MLALFNQFSPAYCMLAFLDRNIMSTLAGTPPVNTILTQALPGSPAMKIQVVSLKSGFDFEVKLSYDPTVSWKNGQQKWLQVVFLGLLF